VSDLTATSTQTSTSVRPALDRLVSLFGAVVVVVLLAAGAGLAYASSFIGGQVHSQLGDQGIVMPTADAFGKLPAADQTALKPFAGQPMTTGAQAKAFADHYILAHLNAASGGKTYDAVSAQYLALSDADKATKDGQALGQLRQTMFMGSTLRGLLLNAYAFGTMGVVAGFAAIGAFAAAILLAVFVLLGLRHAKKA
jgi:hypothetical protein